MKALIALAAALALAGCNTTGTAPVAPPAVPASAVDQKIADVSRELADQCALLRTGIVLARAFVEKEKAQKVLAVAEAARAQFCAAPPVDTATAIQTVAAMAIAVNQALKEQPL